MGNAEGTSAATMLLIEAEAYVKSIFALLSQKVTKADCFFSTLCLLDKLL